MRAENGDVIFCANFVFDEWGVCRTAPGAPRRMLLPLSVTRCHAWRHEDWDDDESLDALYLWREDQMFAKPAAQS